MMKINISTLMKELSCVPEYKHDKSNGYSYLYQNLYIPFINGNNVVLDNINFDMFTLNDVQSMADDYYDNYSQMISKNDNFKKCLLSLKPDAVNVDFI